MRVLPTGHTAAGVLVGAARVRRTGARGRRAAATLALAALAGNLPDLDMVVPSLLDAAGRKHRLATGEHHGWATHTPLFWAAVDAALVRFARHRPAGSVAGEAAVLLAMTSAVHIALDATANTVALLWPLRRRAYGLGLDRLPGVTDHAEYIRRYPASPAGWLEAALVLAALAVIHRHTRSGVIGS